MIRHVFTLIWNRKRANALIMLELLITFLILFALVGFSLNLYRLYGKPLGFNVANTWSVTISTGGAWSTTDDPTFHQVLSVANQFEEVLAAEIMFDRPFDISTSSTVVTFGDITLPRVVMNSVSPGFPDAVGMRLVEGRWFGPEDDNQSSANETILPVVVNRMFSEQAGSDVVGALLPLGQDRQRRIVGVFEEFRMDGQFSAPEPTMFHRSRIDSSYAQAPGLALVLKPGITAQFEENLLDALQRTAPNWDFDVTSWESLEDSNLRLYLIPLLIVSILVLFLLLMVGFGLLGVLWQSVIRRTPEMGVRRAMGASASNVRLQVVLELIAVACLALVPGWALVVQLPLAGIIRAMDWALFMPSAVASTVILLALCILFALYPSYQATRKDPVEALRYE